MKDIKLQWAIAKVMAWYCNDYKDWQNESESEKDKWFLRAGDIMDKIEASGYCKVRTS